MPKRTRPHPVLGIREMLQHVLLSIDTFEGLNASMLVCKSWCELVQDYYALKRRKETHERQWPLSGISRGEFHGPTLFVSFIVSKWNDLDNIHFMGLLSNDSVDYSDTEIAFNASQTIEMLEGAPIRMGCSYGQLSLYVSLWAEGYKRQVYEFDKLWNFLYPNASEHVMPSGATFTSYCILLLVSRGYGHEATMLFRRAKLSVFEVMNLLYDSLYDPDSLTGNCIDPGGIYHRLLPCLVWLVYHLQGHVVPGIRDDLDTYKGGSFYQYRFFYQYRKLLDLWCNMKEEFDCASEIDTPYYVAWILRHGLALCEENLNIIRRLFVQLLLVDPRPNVSEELHEKQRDGYIRMMWRKCRDHVHMRRELIVFFHCGVYGGKYLIGDALAGMPSATSDGTRFVFTRSDVLIEIASDLMVLGPSEVSSNMLPIRTLLFDCSDEDFDSAFNVALVAHGWEELRDLLLKGCMTINRRRGVTHALQWPSMEKLWSKLGCFSLLDEIRTCFTHGEFARAFFLLGVMEPSSRSLSKGTEFVSRIKEIFVPLIGHAAVDKMVKEGLHGLILSRREDRGGMNCRELYGCLVCRLRPLDDSLRLSIHGD